MEQDLASTYALHLHDICRLCPTILGWSLETRVGQELDRGQTKVRCWTECGQSVREKVRHWQYRKVFRKENLQTKSYNLATFIQDFHQAKTIQKLYIFKGFVRDSGPRY